MLVQVGADVTVKELNASEFPCGAMTLTLRAARGASDAIVIVTGRLVSVRPVPMVAVTPDPLKTTAVAPVKPVPLTVAPRVLFTTPEFGLIPVITGRACVTVKLLNGADVPLGVVTVTVLAPSPAPAAIVTVMGRLVAVPPVSMVAVTPLPLNVTAVAPPRPVPLMVAGWLVPAAPEDGLIPVIIGTDVTVKPLNAGDVPIGVVTVKVRVSVDAPAAIVTVMGRLVAVPPVSMVAVTPLPLNVTAVAPPRPVPLMVAGWLVPAAPEDGLIPVIIGPDVTVKPLNAGDVPIGVVTVKVRVSVDAPAAIVTVMGRLVAVPPVSMVAVTPLPLNVTAVAPPRPVPLMVAGWLVPAAPEDGLIPVIIGTDVTVKPLNAGDVPIGVVTVKVRVSVDAPAAIVTVMGRLVAVPPVSMVAVTPLPLNVTAVAPPRPVPLMVAGWLVPAAPEDGLIPVIIGPDVTVKPLNAGDVPIGVVTVKVRVSVDAPAAIVTVMGRLVAVPPVSMVAVTPLPLNVTAVAPPRPVPLMVAGWLVPAAPEDGLIPVIIGTDVTVKPLNAGDVPIGVVTVKVRVSVDAPAAIVTVMGRLVAVPPVSMVAVTPLPLNVTAVAPPRPVPLMVAGWLVPAAPEDGLIPVIMGTDVTVKPLNAGDVPIGVVTVKVRVSVDAPAAIVTVMGRLVAVPPVSMVAVTPLPLNVTAVAPPRPVPLMVAGWLVPAAPEDGLIPVIIGTDVTVKPLNAGDVPIGVVTVKVRVSVDAPAAIVTVMGRLVAVPPVSMVAVTPLPLNVTAVAPPRPVPLMVAGWLVP